VKSVAGRLARLPELRHYTFQKHEEERNTEASVTDKSVNCIFK
jgi:hypothetical protein